MTEELLLFPNTVTYINDDLATAPFQAKFGAGRGVIQLEV